MDESLRAQLDVYLPHLDGLIRRGRELCVVVAADPSSGSALASIRAWQQDCATTVNQLSGLSKTHWLARAYSQAFLMRSAGGGVIEEVTLGEIVDRIIDVLGQAVASLSQLCSGDEAARSSASAAAVPQPRRFEFVHSSELRPIVEQAYTDSRRALEQGRYGTALFTACGILEAIVTDALEHKGLGAVPADDRPPGEIAGWSFEARLAAAERSRLIRSGCARLPAIARKYREATTGTDGESDAGRTISEREARVTGQVLHVVMRDLDPGR